MIEFIISFLQEKIVGMVAWDYSNHILNFNGRTSVPAMIAWGFLGLAFIKFLYPLLYKIIDKTMAHIKISITVLMMLFITIDILVSGAVVLRQAMRHKGMKQYTIIDQILDTYFDDEYIKKKYPNSFVKANKG